MTIIRYTLAAVLLGASLANTSIAQAPGARHIYPEIESADKDVNAAIALAQREHKRVLIDFGGDWCPDCQVLDIYAGQSPNKELLRQYFVKVNVNIGHMDANRAMVARYGLPDKGVPELVVLDSHGKLIYAQHKEFSSMRNMKPEDLTDFLNKWKQ